MQKGAHRGCAGEDRQAQQASPAPQPPESPHTQRGPSLNLAEGTCPRLGSLEPQVLKGF